MTIKFKTSEQFKELQKLNIIPQTYAPAYGGESSCIDLYATQDVTINAEKQNTLISTGIYLALEKNQTGLILERGSILKTPLKVRAGVIDPGYTGEVFVNAIIVANHIKVGAWQRPILMPEKYTIEKGNKLPFQLLVINHTNDYQELTDEEYDSYINSASRKEGKIGSSNG